MEELEILWEDEDLLVLNKKAGITVNRAQSEKSETVQDLLMKYFRIADLGIGDRAGIVHRLDKETSGCLLVAKNEAVYSSMTKQFQERSVEKTYQALVHGKLEGDVMTNLPLGRHPKKRQQFAVLPFGRESETKFALEQVLRFKEGTFRKLAGQFPKKREKFLENHAFYYSLVSAKPKTGRTHQIRLHSKYLGHPVVSDPAYAGKLYDFDKFFCPRLFLHASSITFSHPATRERVTFRSPLPGDLSEVLSYFESALGQT